MHVVRAVAPCPVRGVDSDAGAPLRGKPALRQPRKGFARSPLPPAASVEEREGGRPEHVEGAVCQRKLDACSTKRSPRAPLPLRHHRLDGKTKRPGCRRHMISTEVGR
ncbi:unnamed protein product [Ectocarpus sp. 13 AM-2016]